MLANVIRMSCCAFLLITGVIEARAAGPCDPATNAKAVAEAREGIDKIKKVVSQLRSSGLPIPKGLANAMTVLNRFATAADMGVDVAEAAGQADYEVQKIVANKYSLCEGDDDEKFVCYAKIDHVWMARNVNAVLNWDNPGSVVRRTVEKWLGAKCDKDDDLGGVSVNVDVEGTPADLSDIRKKVLQIK